jgi:hypothetical protein
MEETCLSGHSMVLGERGTSVRPLFEGSAVLLRGLALALPHSVVQWRGWPHWEGWRNSAVDGVKLCSSSLQAYG